MEQLIHISTFTSHFNSLRLSLILKKAWLASSTLLFTVSVLVISSQAAYAGVGLPALYDIDFDSETPGSSASTADGTGAATRTTITNFFNPPITSSDPQIVTGITGMTGNSMQLVTIGSLSPGPNFPAIDGQDQAQLILNTYPQCNSYSTEADVKIVSDFTIGNEVFQIFLPGGKVMFRPDGTIDELLTSATPTELTATYVQGTAFHVVIATDFLANSWSIQIDSGTAEVGSLTGSTFVSGIRFTGPDAFQDFTTTIDIDNILINASGCNNPTIGTNPDILNQQPTGPNGALIAYADPAGSGADGTPATVVCTPASPVLVAPGVTQQVDCVATDLLGQIATSSFDIEVIDPTPPPPPPPSPPVGGEIIPIQTISLLLAGAQSFSWMIPVVLSILGIGLFVVSRKSE